MEEWQSTDSGDEEREETADHCGALRKHIRAKMIMAVTFVMGEGWLGYNLLKDVINNGGVNLGLLQIVGHITCLCGVTMCIEQARFMNDALRKLCEENEQPSSVEPHFEDSQKE